MLGSTSPNSNDVIIKEQTEHQPLEGISDPVQNSCNKEGNQPDTDWNVSWFELCSPTEVNILNFSGCESGFIWKWIVR